jgi:hypothetical protein
VTVNARIAEHLRRKAEVAKQRGDLAAHMIATARFWQYVGTGR